jgi:DNA-binding transcriptional regulator YiaG
MSAEPALPDLNHLKAADLLNVDVIHALDLAFRPTRDEVAGMIDELCRCKKWTRGTLAAILGISPDQLRAWEMERAEVSRPSARLIWFLYTLNTAPEKALSLEQILSWGKAQSPLPSGSRKKLPPGTKQAAQEWIKAWKGYRLTAKHIAEQFRTSEQTAHAWARGIGYRLADRRRSRFQKKRTPSYLKPGSVFLKQDWSLSDVEIAERIGSKSDYVKYIRLQYRKMPIAVLKRQLKACGANVDNFERIFIKRVRKFDRRKMTPNFAI